MSMMPSQGVQAQGSLCSLGDAGLPLPTGSQASHSWLLAMPWKAEIPARVSKGLLGNGPVPKSEQTSGLRPSQTPR